MLSKPSTATQQLSPQSRSRLPAYTSVLCQHRPPRPERGPHIVVHYDEEHHLENPKSKMGQMGARSRVQNGTNLYHLEVAGRIED